MGVPYSEITTAEWGSGPAESGTLLAIKEQHIAHQEWAAFGANHRAVAFAAALLTVVAIGIQGYHPYAEDGGLYLAGILKELHPALYPAWTHFVTAQLRFSLFAPLTAALVRASGLNPMPVLLAIYAATIWATLFAGGQIAARCYASRHACYGAMGLLTVWLTMPIAGTSLMLMDPYVTARSISTPCSLLALVGMLDIADAVRHADTVARPSVALCVSSLLVAGVVHPLMAAYAAGSVVLLFCSAVAGRRRIAAIAAVCLFSLAAAAGMYLMAPPNSSDYAQVAHTRSYWFLANWHWYEVAGLVAPLLVLIALAWRWKESNESARALARMAIAAGVTGLLVAILFARESSPTYVVARLQPLRIFQIIYIVMILALGSYLGERVLRNKHWRWVAMLVALGGINLFVQLEVFPNSAHLEFPGSAPRNAWTRAFVWIREHTPESAVFALDADYITVDGEDTQGFRAIAERSAPPDYSKDGGVAAIAPELTNDWVRGVAAQQNLDTEGDAQRMQKLLPLGVDWVVLTKSAATAFTCPYANDAVKVCRIGRVVR